MGSEMDNIVVTFYIHQKSLGSSYDKEGQLLTNIHGFSNFVYYLWIAGALKNR